MSTDADSAQALLEETLSDLRTAGPRLPRAAYRVQFNHAFTFRDALPVVDYLAELGASDLYASPFFRARPASMHGYDTVDHNSLNPEIGNEADFEELGARLRGHRLGHLLDFVPNHMGIGVRENAWWMDVLENGPSSIYAPFFDIAWSPLKDELENKVLLPVLGDHYGQALENGELKVRFEAGGFFVDYWDHVFPVNPRTYPRILEPMIAQLLDGLGPEDDHVLELQSIITGLRHLPPRGETHRLKVLERRREKEILKRRLQALVGEVPAFNTALGESLARLNGVKNDARSFDALHELLEAQAFRLSFWRVAAEEINYRRFFDINDLAAIRMEHPAVFREAHQLLFKLLADNRVTGLRIDHPDGLWDPTAYFLGLQRRFLLARCRLRLARTSPDDHEAENRWRRLEPELTSRVNVLLANPAAVEAKPLFVVVEKILSRGELLPRDWLVHGTSGYDFTTSVGGLFVAEANEREVTEVYERFIGERLDFADLVYEKKKLVLESSLASELQVLGRELDAISEKDRHSRDFTRGSLIAALREVIACFPVYRTYFSPLSEGPSEHDRLAINRAIRFATQRSPTTDVSIYRFIQAVLLQEVPQTAPAGTAALLRNFVMRFQQLTGPVMAKGVEDTAFYIYNRLVSLNEVGGEPEHFGRDVEAFHRENRQRHQHWPSALLATSTHDTKRSEDVRARISVLSELPGQWDETLASASRAVAVHKTDVDGRLAPDRNEEYLFHQTLLGTLPFDLARGLTKDFTQRIVDYMRKATKEAKVNTSWINAAPEYDAAVEAFVRRALEEPRLLNVLGPLARTVSYHGMWSSLSQLLLKLTSPGVPDVYQGNELWDFSLVDPDNRRPVDFALRQRMLTDLRRRRVEGEALARELVAEAEDGRIKLFVTHVALQLRKAHPAAFDANSTYDKVEATGTQAAHAVSFSRRFGETAFLVVAPRLTASLVHGGRDPPIGRVWKETSIPTDGGEYFNHFTGATLVSELRRGRAELRLEDVLSDFPLALLERRGR